ncbi:MAG: hypothetical protein H5U07_03900 [Candidatus Aminicenantes bacterium]|nr:hypothetical protein [Candidatus Aminicenantes bacterium]
MTKKDKRKLRVALIGTDSLRGQEIKNLLGTVKFPIKSMEFYDPEVEEEYSKLTEFKEEPKVIHHPDPYLLEGLDLVFLAADRETNRRFGYLAKEKGYRAIDLRESFVDDLEVPVVVVGVNDYVLKEKDSYLISNPNPGSILLTQVFAAIQKDYQLQKAVAMILQPVSAYENEGIEELAEQSYALLSSTSLNKKVFREQIAFNFLPAVDRPETDGFSLREKQIKKEVGRILSTDFAFSLSLVQAPVFHVCSVMIFVELKESLKISDLEKVFANREIFKLIPAGAQDQVCNVKVAGQDKIYIGHIKKDDSIKNGYWLYAAADNLTVGSALNALNIARKMFDLD